MLKSDAEGIVGRLHVPPKSVARHLRIRTKLQNEFEEIELRISDEGLTL